MRAECEPDDMEPEATAQPAAKVPLVLDLDGTLLRTDLLHETFWAALGHDTAATLRVSIAHIGSPSRLKHELAAIATPCIDLLPLEERLLERVHAALGEGRPVHLVSGSAQGLVDAVAARLGLPGPHFGSDRETNLTGDAKAGFLRVGRALGKSSPTHHRKGFATDSRELENLSISLGRIGNFEKCFKNCARHIGQRTPFSSFLSWWRMTSIREGWRRLLWRRWPSVSGPPRSTS